VGDYANLIGAVVAAVLVVVAFKYVPAAGESAWIEAIVIGTVAGTVGIVIYFRARVDWWWAFPIAFLSSVVLATLFNFREARRLVQILHDARRRRSHAGDT